MKAVETKPITARLVEVIVVEAVVELIARVDIFEATCSDIRWL